ncbi:uncharacterized protein [Parasteatoda tepidariorum]|uniref:uncharacterized protein n=1 Tax=Parasteatoda tepidariorum TaxID=114398 RepID=UPI00077FB819|nr:uncharacterized protein LOC107448638 [Parasteatoda tepidariorum]
MTENSNTMTSRDFGLFAVFGVISLQIIVVKSYPMGIEGRNYGIHQRQPNYLPTYNGIFSIHALNFTTSAFDKSENNLQVDGQDTTITTSASNTTSEQLQDSNESLSLLSNPETKQSQDLLNQDIDGSDINELDSDKEQDDDPTFPQIQVITKTITDETFSKSSTANTGGTTQKLGPVVRTETTSTTVPSTEDVFKFVTFNNSETLLSGQGNDPVETDGAQEDIFDNLMKRIQSHWLEFVGKMKLSVLDVWKSISQHMMERLESFASAL